MKNVKSPYHLAMDILNPATVNSLLNDAFQTFDNQITNKYFTPRYQWSKTALAYELQLDLPGMTKENVNVSIENQELAVSGERKKLELVEGQELLSTSIPYGHFHLKFTMPLKADTSAAKASFENGVLQLHIPISEKAQKQIIEIK